MKYCLIFFIAVFFYPFAFADVCKKSFSDGEIDRQALLRKADKELKQALKEIRESPQEPVLKEQGFKPEYYKGMEQAREFNAVAGYLRKIKADSKRTHIPYFADQVEKTISDFENSFREYNQNNTEFLEERLKLLKILKKEARQRMEDKNITYSWWTLFNFRLIMITLAPNVMRIILRAKLHDPSERVKMGIEISYNKELVQAIEEVEKRLNLSHLKEEFEQLIPEEIFFEESYTSQRLEKILNYLKIVNRIDDQRLNIQYILESITSEKMWHNADLETHERMQGLLSDIARYIDTYPTSQLKYGQTIRHFIHKIDKFPKEIMFFTTDELGIMAFNRLENNSHLIGITGKPRVADDSEKDSIDFFEHDLYHALSANEVQIPQKILEKVSSISRRSKREAVELALFMYHHEDGYDFFGPELVEYYSDTEINFSQSELRQIIEKIKKNTKEMMRYARDNKTIILPDGVNINNKNEVAQFLKKSEKAFVEILLAR